MLLIRASSTSEGCQFRCGNAEASFTTCCPVPLAISSALPDLIAVFFTNSTIGLAFLIADGALRRPSPSEFKEAGCLRKILTIYHVGTMEKNERNCNLQRRRSLSIFKKMVCCSPYIVVPHERLELPTH